MTRKLRQDGIKTVEDLQSRCRLDDETGCLIWAGARKASSPRVWVGGRVVSMTGALTLFVTGAMPAGGKVMVPRCGRADCANLKHRFLGTRSDLFAALIPRLTPQHRARIAIGKRKASALYSPEAAHEIRTSGEPIQELADKHGMHLTHACRIRRGEAWRDVAAGASVFALGGMAGGRRA